MSAWCPLYELAVRLSLMIFLIGTCNRVDAQSDTKHPDSQQPRSTAASGTISRPIVAPPRAGQTSPFLPPIEEEVRLPVALRGFCAVTLREQQQWADGSEQYQHVFDGQLYWFASRHEQAVFAANPIRYVPALRGDCVVTFAESGARVPGEPQYGILHNQRLYFFQNPAQQASFRAHPEAYANADLKFDGRCVVSRIDEQRQREGLAETVVVVDGFRYQFAGSHQQQSFLRNMSRYGVQRHLPPQTKLGSDRMAKSPRPLDTSEKMGATKPLVASETKKKSRRMQFASKAMGGYCPVTIRNQSTWVKGEARYAVEFDGQAYLMAGESEQELFRENPSPFIPALGGYCVVTEVDENRREAGNIYHAAFHESEARLFLFAGPEQKQAFNDNTERYLTADLAAEGKCVVSLVEERAEVEGLPEFMSWHAGKRYYFVSEENKAKFDENVSLYQEF